MPLNPEVDAIRDRLLSEYVKAGQDIDRRLLAIADSETKVALRRQLQGLSADVRRTLAELDTAARAWLQTDLPTVYQLGQEGAGLGNVGWSQVHRAAVQVLAEDTYDDLLRANRYMSQSTRQFVRQAAKQHVRGAVLGGKTATQAGRDLTAALRARFGEIDAPAAITYSNGARHSLGEYGQVVARTKSAMAYNVGTTNQSRAAGVTYMECADGSACGLSSHADPDKANGQVFPIDVAESYPLAHPNCSRAWLAMPSVTTPEQARAADRFTDEERQAAAVTERARAEVRTVGGRLTVAEKRRRASGRALTRGRARRVTR